MATVPNPKTWSPGNIPTATEMNTDLRDAINFFKAPPRVLVKNNAQVDIPPQAWTLLTWNTEDADTDAMHSTSSNTSRLVAATAGRYEVKLQIRWEDHLDPEGVRACQIRKNSAGAVGSGNLVTADIRHHQDYLTGDHGASIQHCTGYIYLAASDYVEAFVWHNQNTPIVGYDNSLVEHDMGDNIRFGALWVSTL